MEKVVVVSPSGPKVPQDEPVVQLGWMANKPGTMKELQFIDPCTSFDMPVGTKFYLHPPEQALPQGVDDAYQALQNELIQIRATIESFATPAAALSALIDWHVSVATDPRVNGGMAIVPVEASAEITFEIRGEKIVFCKDGVYFALTKDQIPAMHAAMLAATKEKSYTPGPLSGVEVLGND